MEYKEKTEKKKSRDQELGKGVSEDIVDNLNESLNGPEDNNAGDLALDSDIDNNRNESRVHPELMSQNVFRNFWLKYTHHLNEKWEEKNIVEKGLYFLEYPFHLLMYLIFFNIKDSYYPSW